VLKEIHSLNSDLLKIESRINFLSESKKLFRSIKIKNLTNDKKRIRKRLFTLIDEFLLKNDPVFKNIAEETINLFKKDNISFKVTKHDRHEMASMTYKYEGKVSKNGYSYIYESGTNLAILPLDGFACPIKLKGKINHWGKIEIDVTEKELKFNALPENFKGSISDKGVIQLEIDKRSNDLFLSGKLVVGEIMAFHFSRSSTKLKRLLNNKRKMLIMIREFRNDLKSDYR